jgi:predicted permease
MAPMTQDLRDAVRLLWKSPHLSVGIALSFGIALALALSIVNIASVTVFREIPTATDRGRLSRVYLSRSGGGQFSVPYPVYEYFRDHTTSFSHLAAQTAETETVAWNRGSGDPERIEATLVSGSFFDALGIAPASGRFVADDELSADPAAYAVISYRLWQRRFDLRPDAVGATVQFNGQFFTIIGVAPRTFAGVQVGVGSDVWLPITAAETVTGRSDLLRNPDGQGFMVIGRLSPTSTGERAQADLNVLARQFDAQFASPDGARGAVVRRAVGVGPPLEDPLLLFLAALFTVGIVALIVAGSNTLTLLLMRAEARRSDTAVRLALGARRSDIIRRQLCETCALTLMAGATACAIVVISSGLLTVWLPTELPLTIDFTPDLRVLGIGLGGSLLLGLILSITPVVRRTPTDLTRSITRIDGQTSTPSTSRSRHVLMFIQASAAMALVVCATILSRSIDSVTRVELGFPTSDLHVVSISNGRVRDLQRRQEFLRQLEQRTSANPRLTAATAWFFPFSQASDKVTVTRAGGGQVLRADYNLVGKSYFDVMGIPILRGRALSADDDGIVINEHLASQMFPGEDPLRQVLQLDPVSYPSFGGRQVIGIARQAKYRAPWESPIPYVYVALSRFAPPAVSLVVRTPPRRAEEVLLDVVREIRALEPEVTGVRAESFETSIQEVFLWTRVTRVFFAIAAFAALSVAAVGVFATLSYSIRQRTREIAIRVALGATRRNVVGWIAKQTGLIVGIGAVVGAVFATALALALTQIPVISVQGDDPVSYVGAMMLFILAIAVATFSAVRNVNAITPWSALRSE